MRKLAVILIICSLGLIGYGLYDNHERAQATKDIRKARELVEEQNTLFNKDREYPVQKFINISKLKENISQDIQAWITVPGTSIDEPVALGNKGNDYWLFYDLEGNYSINGSLFYDEGSQDSQSPYAITFIFGHYSTNHLKFTDLDYYFKDDNFIKEYNKFYIYQEDNGTHKEYTYEILGKALVEPTHILYSQGPYTHNDFTIYQSLLQQTFNTDNFDKTDRFVILATCYSDQSDSSRKILLGKLIETNEY